LPHLRASAVTLMLVTVLAGLVLGAAPAAAAAGRGPAQHRSTHAAARHPRHGAVARHRMRPRQHDRHRHGRALGARAHHRPTPAVQPRPGAMPLTGAAAPRARPSAAAHRPAGEASRAALVAAGSAPAARSPRGSPGHGLTVLAPLRRLGAVLGSSPGLSPFGGPRGWLYGAALLVALAMIGTGLLGWQPLVRARQRRS
jgi:hypothetical protein